VKHEYRLYLETSFWDRLADPLKYQRRRITYQFLNRSCRGHVILISPLVLREVRQTPNLDERRVIERRMQAAYHVMVSGEHRALACARALASDGGFGDRILADLTHLGYALHGRADAVVTWDHRTFARDKVRAVLHRYCLREGLKPPLLGLPEEVIQWLGLRT
jgi:hypothetical protein